MLKKETLFLIYAPPAAGLPFLSVIFKACRRYNPLVTSFATAAEAEAFNHEMRIEMGRSRSGNKIAKIPVPAITPNQARAARELLKWTRDNLSAASGVSIGTVNRFEMSDGIVKPSTVAALRSALESAGIEFIIAKGGGACVRRQKTEAVASVPTGRD